MNNAFVALGSNLDDPRAQVLKAMDSIDALPECQIIKKSSLYVTSPVGYLDQPDFINAVIKISTSFAPLELLAVLLDIEQDQGRVRSFKNAPRTLDLDLLMYDNVVMDTPDLILPHPRMQEREFVMRPLLEIGVLDGVKTPVP